jgi:rubrerythrin
MHAKTKANLLTAMHGEAFAYGKYMLFAKEARGHGHGELADLYEKTANVEFLEWVAWFNTQRLLEPLGYLPPAEYEEQYHRASAAQATEVALT